MCKFRGSHSGHLAEALRHLRLCRVRHRSTCHGEHCESVGERNRFRALIPIKYRSSFNKGRLLLKRFLFTEIHRILGRARCTLGRSRRLLLFDRRECNLLEKYYPSTITEVGRGRCLCLPSLSRGGARVTNCFARYLSSVDRARGAVASWQTETAPEREIATDYSAAAGTGSPSDLTPKRFEMQSLLEDASRCGEKTLSWQTHQSR